MREYLLYIKVSGGAAQAHITPCFQVDQAFWREREGAQLYVIGKSKSLALAFSLRGELNNALGDHAFTEKSVDSYRALASTHVREATVLYGKQAAGMTPIEKEWLSLESVGGSGEQADTLPLSPSSKDTLEDTDELKRESERLLAWMSGRALLWDEVGVLLNKKGWASRSLEYCFQWMILSGKAERRPGIEWRIRRSWLRHRMLFTCARCGSEQTIVLTRCHSCRQGCAYCTECLDMGRSKCCTPYFCVPRQKASQAYEAVSPGKLCERTVNRGFTGERMAGTSYERRAALLDWQGTYSPMQKMAAEKARQFVASDRPGLGEFLLWAVCGAGKTELLFPSVAETLRAGGQVLIATPRKDVVLELAPRIAKVFPNARVIAVHGSSTEKWEDSDITIATTHQVMRFYHRFPLVVLDEVDAFPYHNNPVLYRVVSRAVQPGGKILYLSATPPRYLQKRLVPKRAQSHMHSRTHVLLPGRYHGSPLPVPLVCTVRGLHKHLSAGRSIRPLLETLAASLDGGRQVFVFVPRVDQVPVVLGYLQRRLPGYSQAMAGVHAADPEREEKVRLFRAKQLLVMVTTTILERGVTIPRSDVIVVGTEAPVFDEASLVQIAGRVGRSSDAPSGTVLFIEEYRTSASRAAIRQINRMNQLAASLQQAGGQS
ncbi:DEAD/DEAH box helicase [Brevibacillus borstelensis]|uniref:DEAD/DEAH box helicase n=1 Tax=Brevibacillus borstelensis TaxID=45462 RepID=UPI002E2515C8|nr:helicase-related protein [Brevibacillus borstelensis]